MRREVYMGVTKSFSVGARRSQWGFQMWITIQAYLIFEFKYFYWGNDVFFLIFTCESSHTIHIQACWLEMKSSRKSPRGQSK